MTAEQYEHPALASSEAAHWTVTMQYDDKEREFPAINEMSGAKESYFQARMLLIVIKAEQKR